MSTVMCSPEFEPQAKKQDGGNEERKYETLINMRAHLTIEIMLLHHDSAEERRRLVSVNAEIHRTGERLKRLHRSVGDDDYALPG